MHCSTIVNEKTIFYWFPFCFLSFWLSLPLYLSQLLPPHSLSHISLIQSLHQCWVLDFGFWISMDRCAGISWWWVWISWSVGLNQWICWSVGRSVNTPTVTLMDQWVDRRQLRWWLRLWFFLNGFVGMWGFSLVWTDGLMVFFFLM